MQERLSEAGQERDEALARGYEMGLAKSKHKSKLMLTLLYPELETLARFYCLSFVFISFWILPTRPHTAAAARERARRPVAPPAGRPDGGRTPLYPLVPTQRV
eukprot:231302-Pleurochrysis_carterae.AAC.1